MSDRIDELLTRPLGYQNARAYAVKHELATIAREAEAMVDWLVQYAADCGECPRTRYDEDEDGCRECLDSIRRSAHKAVSK